MRIFFAGAGPREREAVLRTLADARQPHEVELMGSGPELGARLKEPRAFVVLASSAKGWDASATIRLCAEVKPGCPCIGLAPKGDHEDARRLVEAGALDAFPADQLWRLPMALERAAEAGARAKASERMLALETLVEAVKNLSLARRMDDIVDVVRRAARRLSQADGASFVLRDGDQCHYVDEDAIGPLWRGKRFPLDACISGWAMLNKRAAVVPDIYADPRIPIEAYRPTFVRSLVMVPIRTEDPIGAIGTYWAREREVGEDQVALIQTLADSAALAVDNVQVYAGLERKVRERTASLEAVNKELEAFARSVSHDLRSPLAVIVGYSDMLADEARSGLAKADRAKAADIRAAALRMNVLIDDMLRLSQVIQREVEPRRVDLSALAEDILGRLAENEPGRRVEAKVEPGLWAVGDPGLIRIALDNLLSNAWKYTSKREAAHIGFGRTEVPGKGPAFFVRDDGAGFEMGQARRLFKPFQRLHATSDFPGTGVGLATVSRVMEKHGGSIWAEAEKGKGAVFYFELPAPAGMLPPPPESGGAAKGEALSGAGAPLNAAG
jgi:signal transduction histidine kinase